MYQPTITRLPSLLCLFLITLALIALTELACRRLPAHTVHGIIKSVPEQVSTDVDGILSARWANPYPQEDAGPTFPGAPAPNAFLGVSDDAASSATPIDTAVLPVVTATSSSNDPVVTPVASVTDAIPTATTSSSDDTITSPSLLGGSIMESTDAASSTQNSPVVTASSSETTVRAPNPNAFLPPDSQTAVLVTSTAAPTSTAPSPLVAGTIDPSIPGTTTGFTAGEWYTIEASGVAIVGGQTFSTANPTTATFDDGNVVSIGPTGLISIEKSEDEPIHTVTLHDYLIGAFVPIISAVIFSIPWHILAAAIREMEPFYELQRTQGAPAEQSLGLNYRSSIGAIATINAIRNGHYLVWWSGLISISILFLSPLASETVFIGFVGDGVCTATSQRSACVPLLSVFPAAARAVQGILALVAVLTFFLAIAIVRGKSGVFANPLSIAALATLFQDQTVVDDFRRIGVHTPNADDINKALRGRTYRIGDYVRYDGQPEYGLTTVRNNVQNTAMVRQTSIFGRKKYTSVAVDAVEETPTLREQKKQLSRMGTHPIILVIFGLFICGLVALVIYYNRVATRTGFERFMDSESFGTRFLFTAVGVIIKMYWTFLDDDLRTNEPYHQLLSGSVPADASILLAPRSNPFTGFFASLCRAQFLNAYLSLVAILCEPLIICLAHIPFKPSTTFTSYTAATWITAAILVMMLVGLIWVLSKKGRREGRAPETLAGVLVLICGSHMLTEFQGMANLRGRERDKIVKGREKKYSLGGLVGVDGVEREGVDESVFVGRSTALQG